MEELSQHEHSLGALNQKEAGSSAQAKELERPPGAGDQPALQRPLQQQDDSVVLPALTPLGQITQRFRETMKDSRRQPEGAGSFLKDKQLIQQRLNVTEDQAAITNVSIWKNKSSTDRAALAQAVRSNQYHFFGVQGSQSIRVSMPPLQGVSSLLSPVASLSSYRSVEGSARRHEAKGPEASVHGSPDPTKLAPTPMDQKLNHNMMIGDTSVQHLMLNSSQLPLSLRSQNNSIISLGPAAHSTKNSQNQL